MPIAKADRVAARKIVQQPGRPRACGAAGQCGQHDGAEDAAVLSALENFQHHRAHDRGQAVAERALGEDHQIDQRQHRREFQGDQRGETDRKAEAADGPDPFAPDPVGEMPEPDLAGNAEQADDAERPHRHIGGEADVEQEFGLVHLHRVPDVQAAEIAERNPPEARGTQRAAQRPVGIGPHGIDDVRARCGRCRRRRGIAIRQQADLLGALAQQQIDRRQHGEDQNAHRGAGGAPAGLLDHVLHPWQQGHRADADAGEGEPDGEPAAANEPVRQKQRLAGIAEAHAARADQHADREIEMPGLRGQRREQQAAAHQRDAELHHPARPEAIHHAPDQRAGDGGRHEAEGKRAGGDAALPSEFAMIGGKNSENAVRALTPIAMVTNVTATISQP